MHRERQQTRPGTRKDKQSSPQAAGGAPNLDRWLGDLGRPNNFARGRQAQPLDRGHSPKHAKHRGVHAQRRTCSMNLGMTLWNTVPLYVLPSGASPVQSCRDRGRRAGRAGGTPGGVDEREDRDTYVRTGEGAEARAICLYGNCRASVCSTRAVTAAADIVQTGELGIHTAVR